MALLTLKIAMSLNIEPYLFLIDVILHEIAVWVNGTPYHNLDVLPSSFVTVESQPYLTSFMLYSWFVIVIMHGCKLLSGHIVLFIYST